MKLTSAFLLFAASEAFQSSPALTKLPSPSSSQRPSAVDIRRTIAQSLPPHHTSSSSTSLQGKLWKKLEIEEDPPGSEPQ
eukprot:scaffold4068_cov172-Alexandrium_tamarense.AAC.1